MLVVKLLWPLKIKSLQIQQGKSGNWKSTCNLDTAHQNMQGFNQDKKCKTCKKSIQTSSASPSQHTRSWSRHCPSQHTRSQSRQAMCNASPSQHARSRSRQCPSQHARSWSRIAVQVHHNMQDNKNLMQVNRNLQGVDQDKRCKSITTRKESIQTLPITTRKESIQTSNVQCKSITTRKESIQTMPITTRKELIQNSGASPSQH